MRPLVASLLLRWFAVAGGLTAYVIAIVGGFWLVPVACTRTGPWVLHALMAMCLALATVSLLVARVLWRDSSGPAPWPDTVPERQRLMALAGVVLGVLSIVLVLFHWAPVFVLDPCR